MTLALVKITLVMLLALAGVAAARRAAAATRHAILVAGQLAALAVPLLGPLVPRVDVPWNPPRIKRTVAPPRIAAGGSAPAMPLPRRARHIDINPLLALWLLGCAAVAARRMRSLLCAAAVVRRARRWNGVRLSDEAAQPFTLGRSIVLPAGAPAWDAARLEAVLLHERAHVARYDSLTGLAGDAACAVYWFHPLTWLLAKRARLERERACDEAVLAHGVAATSYAAVLLDVARGASSPAHGLPMAARSELGRRIEAILCGQRASMRRGARALLVACALVATPLVAALSPSSSEPDLRGDAIAEPSSEWIGATPLDVVAAGPDAALIATMQTLAARAPQSEIDLVPDRARWALHQVRGGVLVEPLIDALRDDDWRVRAYAAWALGVARDRRATSSLLPLLRDRVWRMRAMAAFALAEIADPAAHEAMLDALGDPAWQVRVEAVHYLGAMRLPTDRDVLLGMRADRHVVVRDAATEATR